MPATFSRLLRRRDVANTVWEHSDLSAERWHMSGKRRRWSQWPRRISEQLNGVSGVAGVGGLATSLAGWSLLAGNVALALTGVGAATTAAALGYAVYKSVPPPLKHPLDLVGSTVGLEDLDDVSPALLRLAIVGATQAGKTTLRNRLAFQLPSHRRTQRVDAYVCSLDTGPASYLAILDGGGESYPQQFKVAEACTFMCIVVDHNHSHTDSKIDLQRQRTHEDFLLQIRNYLTETNAKQLEWIHFLINKQDLWKRADIEERTLFESFCAREIDKWKQGRFAKNVHAAYHSNDNPDDIATFMSLLKKSTHIPRGEGNK
jgi:hypothetical protein